MTFVLTDLHGTQWEVDGIDSRDGLLFATKQTNGSVPIYSIKYNNEFARYYNEHIYDNDDLWDGGQDNNQGDAR